MYNFFLSSTLGHPIIFFLMKEDVNIDNHLKLLEIILEMDLIQNFCNILFVFSDGKYFFL